MGRKSRKNKNIFTIISIFLSILIVISSLLTIYLYIKDKEELKSFKSIDKTYNEKVKELEEQKGTLNTKSEELDKINKEIESYKDINKTIEETKKEFFTKAKELEDKVIAGTTDKKIAYLTFDDGPYNSTYKFFDVLEKYKVQATFFTTSTNGQYCYDNKKMDCTTLYKEYIKRGHTIANHTYTHAIWKGLYSSADSFVTAVINQDSTIKEYADGYVTNIVRFPGGSVTSGKLKQAIIDKLKENGYGWVDWSANDGDGGDLASKEAAWSNFTSTIDDNIEVVLLHDYNYITLSILPDIIEYLQQKNYVLLPLFYESSVINK